MIGALAALLAMGVWATLRLVPCERCGVPFSVAGALYRMLTFEEHRCRRCQSAPGEEGRS